MSKRSSQDHPMLWLLRGLSRRRGAHAAPRARPRFGRVTSMFRFARVSGNRTRWSQADLRSVLPRGGGGWWGRWFSEPDRVGARPVKAAARSAARSPDSPPSPCLSRFLNRRIPRRELRSLPWTSLLLLLPTMTCSRCAGPSRRGCCTSTSTGWSTCATGCRDWGGCGYRWAGRPAGPGRVPGDRSSPPASRVRLPRWRPVLTGIAGFCGRRPSCRPCRWSGCARSGVRAAPVPRVRPCPIATRPPRRRTRPGS